MRSLVIATHDFLGVSTETWGAIGALATALGVLIAAAAAVVAVRQLRFTRATRLDQSRPYVMVTIEPDATDYVGLDIRVRNVGAGPAYDVRITPSPPLVALDRDDGEPRLETSRYFNEPIPLMPPGYELATYFDNAISRNAAREKGKDVPVRFEFALDYHDGHGHRWHEVCTQDLSLIDDLYFTMRLTTHQGVSALRDIAKVIKGSSLFKGEINATVETRAEQVARLQQLREERKQMRERMAQQRSDGEPATES